MATGIIPDGDTYCMYCGNVVPESLTLDGLTIARNHRACYSAWSLDYNPKNEADAQQWLDRRDAGILAIARQRA